MLLRCSNSTCSGIFTLSKQVNKVYDISLNPFVFRSIVDIIYRNVKPENILFATDGYLKLIDFGFAKVVQDRTYTLCGTPDVIFPFFL